MTSTAILTILACLGPVCRPVQPDQDAMSLSQCNAVAMMAAAAWASSHPQYRVAGFSCSGTYPTP